MNWWQRLFDRPVDHEEEDLQAEAKRALERARVLRDEATVARQALWVAVRHAEAVAAASKKLTGEQ